MMNAAGSLVLAWMALCAAESETVETASLARVIAIEDGRLKTGRIVNRIAGTELTATGPEFVLTHDTGAGLSSDEFSAMRLERDGDTVTAVLAHKASGLGARVVYAPLENGPWLGKRITILNESTSPVILRTLEVEHLSLAGESVTYAVDPAFPLLSDWGQPVYTETLWFGLEFPASRSSATSEGTIFLRHHPGITLAPGESYSSKRAVLGAAAKERVDRAFHDYVATLGPHPNPPRVNIYWNGFRVIKPPDRTSQGLRMVEFAKQLKERTAFTFDGWTYDAGFDMYRGDALFVPNEPEIWEKTREALAPIGTPLGFWTSFSCIYDTPTHEWGRSQGFELQHDTAYCLAGPVYYAAIRARLAEIVKTHGMNTINFDGMHWNQGFGCNQPDHGHLAGEGAENGVFSTERVVEHKQAIFESLRAINPDIVLDLFICGEWASPWWLMHLDGVHTVAGDTLGCDIPSPWLRDELITVRDIQVFDEHRRQRRQFPLWAEDLYGTQVRKDHLIDGIVVEGEDMAARWEDEYVMALAGRGAVQNHIICSDLEVLAGSEGGLRFLGEVGNWVRANASIYRHWRLIGGEPAQRQVYGYTHGNGSGRSLVALRNPWIEPGRMVLKIDDQLDLGPITGEVFVNVVYPYRESFAPVTEGDSVTILLQSYAVVLLDVRSAETQFPGINRAVRWTVDPSGSVIAVDTRPLMVIPRSTLTHTRDTEVLELSGIVRVPHAAKSADLRVYTAPVSGPLPPVIVKVNSKEAEARIHRRVREKSQDGWVLVALPPGDHRVNIRIEGGGECRVGAWLHVDYQLAPSGISGGKAPAGLFPVVDDLSESRTVTLFAMKLL